MDLPNDLNTFLTSGHQLEYDVDSCEVGHVTLLTPDRLAVELFPSDMDNAPVDNSEDPHHRELGCYMIPAVSLAADCDGYDPHGLLLWLPNERCYGTWDSSHTLLEVFSSDVSWSDFVANPLRHFNSFWDDNRVGGLAPLIPWPRYDYDPNQPHSPRVPDS